MFWQEPPFEKLSYPINNEKYLSKTDRDLEKTLLSKRQNMIHNEGSDKNDFRL